MLDLSVLSSIVVTMATYLGDFSSLVFSFQRWYLENQGGDAFLDHSFRHLKRKVHIDFFFILHSGFFPVFLKFKTVKKGENW